MGAAVNCNDEIVQIECMRPIHYPYSFVFKVGYYHVSTLDSVNIRMAMRYSVIYAIQSSPDLAVT